MKPTTTSRAAISMIVYGIYIIVGLALPFLFVPALILPIAGMPAPADVWVRVVGMTALVLGAYYILIGRNEITSLMRWSVPLRMSVPVFFVVFVLSGFAPPAMIALAIPDVLFTLWTAFALRGQTTAQTAA